MRHRAAHESHVHHAGKLEIGEVLALAAEQAGILAPRNRFADEHRRVNTTYSC